MLIRELGLVDYMTTLAAMHRFTDARDEGTPDELWVLQHPAVFTQGQAGKPEHVLLPGDIPVVPTDRGGQVTYHGPGQLVVYPLIDIGRRSYGVKSLVSRLEAAMVETLASFDISAYADAAAPGVYVDVEGIRHKIGSLGLRVRQGRSLHGLALNVQMDLEPFRRINPCGYAGLAMTQVSELAPGASFEAVASALVGRLQLSL